MMHKPNASETTSGQAPECICCYGPYSLLLWHINHMHDFLRTNLCVPKRRWLSDTNYCSAKVILHALIPSLCKHRYSKTVQRQRIIFKIFSFGKANTFLVLFFILFTSVISVEMMQPKKYFYSF